MLRRGIRIQHAILELFPSRGTRPTPIWDLRELEPDAGQRTDLQQMISQYGVSEHDFLRWRNACVAVDIRRAVDILKTDPGPGLTPISTPLWVTSHLIRRKVYGPAQASIAAHLALVSVPGFGALVPELESPLTLAFEQAVRYNTAHALPLLVSRMLALRRKQHTELLKGLCNPALTSSPMIATTLQLILDDIKKRRTLLPREIWHQVWQRWGAERKLGAEFSTILRRRIREQGFPYPHYHTFEAGKPITRGAAHYRSRHAPTLKDTRYSSLGALTAAAHSKYVSARLLLAIATSLADGLLSPRRSPISRSQIKRRRKPLPSTSFVTILIQGLVRKKAYGRAIAVWQNSRMRKHRVNLTAPLVEAAMSAYIGNKHPKFALHLLDKYAEQIKPVPSYSSFPHTPFRFKPSSEILALLISHLPPLCQYPAFIYAHRRWSIRPNSDALEAVMLGAMEASKKRAPSDDLDLGRNVRQLTEGFKRLFRRTPGYHPAQLIAPDPIYVGFLPWGTALNEAQVRALKQNAIELFRSVVLGNWPFIGGEENGYGHGLLEKSTIELFVPSKLRVQEPGNTTPVPENSISDTADEDDEIVSNTLAFTFRPSPLHPSPTPHFPNACPTRRAWTAYLGLLAPDELPEALGWMRSADEFLHSVSTQQLYASSNPFNAVPLEDPGQAGTLNLFRPERAALVDALVRWEGAILARETPVGRAWEERRQRKQRIRDGAENTNLDVGAVGREGALRAWLVDWLGADGVPSREEVAMARMEMEIE